MNKTMAREKIYRSRQSFLVNTDLSILQEFDDLCWKERKGRIQKINELMKEATQKNEIGGGTPINISYNENKKVSWKQLKLFETIDTRNKAVDLVKDIDQEVCKQHQFICEAIIQKARTVKSNNIMRVR